MIALYRPGHSLLHRAPAGWKLLGLLVGAVTLTLLPRTVWTAAIAFAAVAALFNIGGIGVRAWAR
ncbi:hypothetical protein [Microbacterium gubbeenense]|uniref:hypothetical protein n=1 Tax=Microbacterium gubbeenense TaxID=159896 RepID=UPI003F9DD663